MSLPPERIFLGSMTGTSLDGMDLVAVSFNQKQQPSLLHQRTIPYPAELKSELQAICMNPDARISDACRMDSWLGEFYAASINQFLSDINLTPDSIEAIGSHGQTIRHSVIPTHPFTLQIGDPHIIAAKTGLKVVADFRRRDIAMGGQGAPLAPAFHHQVFQSSQHQRVIINIGGISNITLIPSDKTFDVIGFDTGPGNTLIDHICRLHLNREFDKDGAQARQGKTHSPLLDRILEGEPYFNLPFPKSTGTDYFSPEWLTQFDITEVNSTDLLTTLTELTAISIARGINRLPIPADECYVCGGGAYNSFLLQRLSHHLGNTPLSTTASLGIDPDWVEAMTFAWLAKQTLDSKPGNLPSVTNAQKFTILGGVYH